MPREGASIFRDLVGRHEVLNVECDKCGHLRALRLKLREENNEDSVRRNPYEHWKQSQ